VNRKLSDEVSTLRRVVKPLAGICLLLLVSLLTFSRAHHSYAQTRGSLSLVGDIKVDESRVEGKKPASLTVVLYTLGGSDVVGRQTVPLNGRYRFNNLASTEYEIGIEVENNEVARVHVLVSGRPGSEIQKDLEFEWKGIGGTARNKPSTISTSDLYHRESANDSLFKQAQQAVDKKRYDDAIILLKRIVDSDNQDFQAWSELGTTYLLLDKKGEAEKAYEKAGEVRPTFLLAFLNLGRVRMAEKKFEDAVSSFTRALEIDPASAEANLLIGEAYLQMKKGSKAVGYLKEAARLGRPEARLRLATLYDAVGMKDQAAGEYQQFLQEKPDYPSRKQLEQYISANKKP